MNLSTIVSKIHHTSINGLRRQFQLLKGKITILYSTVDCLPISHVKMRNAFQRNEVNEIRAERLARTTNPIALVAQQQPVYHPQNHPTQNNQYSSNRSQQPTRNRGKAIVNSSAPTYDQEPVTDAAYHKEKMLLCKQEEAGVQLNAEQADSKDDTDDEFEINELEAH
ncbi:hypothetical protein Tco_1502162 [Tanacetum coccineum]